ncbi:MAG: Na(+)-translocating NADH-quinone reductase subunit A [Bacteroidales bacterium]|nr:Na(+)-translocating NADH-quinone reductase subunit A [Bacteroidales bacterium]
MANVISIKKGLDIKLKGEAPAQTPKKVRSKKYLICPDDFHGMIPKVLVKEGDKVLAGSPIMANKNWQDMQIVSPVSGEIVAVNRGERRKVLSIEILADAADKYLSFEAKSPKDLSAEQITELLLKAGMWPLIKQRPYDVIAKPGTPRDIFISTFDSSPLAPNYEFIVAGQEGDFRTGLEVLQKLTSGSLNLGIRPNSKFKEFADIATIQQFQGPHPAGNVGIQIHHTSPINKGDVVWTLSPADVIIIGRLFNSGKSDFTRTIAVCGSEVKVPYYANVLPGVSVEELTKSEVNSNISLRYISGNVLTGVKVNENESLTFYANQLTVIPEGVETHELFGWAMPRPKQFSMSRTYFDWIARLLSKNKSYSLDARILGGERNIIMSGEYDSVLPMDILPEFLIKATIAFDVDKMENLGIYEIAPEDLALCEFVDTSKVQIQKIIREGLDKLKNEFE